MMDVMGGQLVETAGNLLALLNELKLMVLVHDLVTIQQAQDTASQQLQESIQHMQQQVGGPLDLRLHDVSRFFYAGARSRSRAGAPENLTTHHNPAELAVVFVFIFVRL